MMRIRSLLLALAVAALPSFAFAAPALQAGEFSVGAELIPGEIFSGDFQIDSDRNATPAAGFSLRYAFDNRLALIATLGFSLTTVANDGDDPDARYAVGIGGQFNLVQSTRAAAFLRGGLQFIPRFDFGRDGPDQELGVRLWVGPGVETRVTDSLSLQLYTSMLDLQLGGDTRFDFDIVPTMGLFVHF